MNKLKLDSNCPLDLSSIRLTVTNDKQIRTYALKIRSINPNDEEIYSQYEIYDLSSLDRSATQPKIIIDFIENKNNYQLVEKLLGYAYEYNFGDSSDAKQFYFESDEYIQIRQELEVAISDFNKTLLG